ncbi:MAG TPA: M13 family metallopeptidase N-terminal domain-containing protein, partial [Flavisolibacter sp.]|nr:M13 family metallopeptidase N-terminal domain-containing protein [Flavisolibacter sp.]
MQKTLLLFLAAASLAACNNQVKSVRADDTDSAGGVKADVLRRNMDSAVSPSQDFFLYANGGWIKANPIPPDQGSWGIGNLVIEENLKRLRQISEKAASAKGSQGSSEQKIGDFWSTAMDSAKIEQKGLQPLQPYLDKINTIHDTKSL